MACSKEKRYEERLSNFELEYCYKNFRVEQKYWKHKNGDYSSMPSENFIYYITHLFYYGLF